MQGNINIPDSTITTNLSFRQLVLMNMQQLTNFPYIEKDFDALTDYELLCLVVKFLNDVIANQNEQNDSITRMYESFLALQDYVNNTKDELEDAFNTLDDYVRNYFDNLDVQDEINNKLDQMLEDGVLTTIIQEFIQTNALWIFDNVEAMKEATNLISGSTAKTLGYYSVNDGGGATYYITDSASSDYFQESLDSGLYANLLIENNTIHSKQIGLKGDGTTNETALLQTFYDDFVNYTKVLDKGEYLIDSTLYIHGSFIRRTGTSGDTKFIFNNSCFKYNGSEDGTSVIFYNMFNETIENFNITGDSVLNVVKIIGCWFCNFNNNIFHQVNIVQDTTILNGRTNSTPSSEYLKFNTCRFNYGVVIDNTGTSYINCIHFNNSYISGGSAKPNSITIKGQAHNQGISFIDCDISYATSANFNIVDAQNENGFGNVLCVNCYFDTNKKMFENDEENNMIFTFIGNTQAAYSSNDKTHIKFDKNFLQNTFLGGYSAHGGSLPTLNTNLAINGNFQSDSIYSVAGNTLAGGSGAYWTKEFETSNKGLYNRIRKYTSNVTGSGNLTLSCGTTAPITGRYLAFVRFRLLRTSSDGTNVSLAINGNYQPYYANDLELNTDYILINNKKVLTEGDTITCTLNFTDVENLIIEVYEFGVIPGSIYLPNTPLHGSAILS